LRDAGAEDDYIETIPKRGYRLVQSVNPQPKTPPSEGASSTSLVNNSGSILPVMLLILLAGLALLVIAAIRF
jgi:DNA-binding winged helix-turn-helix (wHTH) protein